MDLTMDFKEQLFHSKTSHKIATTDNSIVCCASISVLAGWGRATPRKIGCVRPASQNPYPISGQNL